MVSIRSALAGICLSSMTLFSQTSGTPLPQAPCPNPTLPVNGGATELAAPTGTLAYVLVGRGVQNYTCSAAGAAPTAMGAIANLYDATSLAKLSTTALHALSPKSVYLPKPKDTAPLLGLPYIGHHFFDSAGTPVFTLTNAKASGPKPIIYVAKTAGIPAPASADKGPAGTGAVDWLLLNEKTVTGYEGMSVGLKQVYRVVTAGGVGGKCEQAGVKSVEYATEYWLYK